ncbi:MAG: methyltransferase domain-containing protein [Gammaproteobacteria bacterium]|nr:methyltransferase domain-containing protein [Gammaproteobacteria bacterium]MBQ0840336.1 methyltransferase domain-containing protein [Gammaproteobacteria bacterium]
MTDQPNAGMAEFWNGNGGKNWVSREARLEASLKPFGQQAMAAGAIEAGQRILDIGFGCGESAIELAGKVGSKGQVHGVDISVAMVEAAEKKAATKGVTNVTFECADAQTSAFAANAYDFVFSRFGVMFFDDPITAFKNIYAALKPGGRLAFICWAPRDQNAWVGLPLQVVAKHLSLPTPPGIDEPGPFSLSEESRVSGVLNAAGFADIAVKPYETAFVLGDNIDEALSFLMQLAPSGSAINNAEADEATRARIGVDMAAMLKSHDGDKGVSMGAAALLVTARKEN